MKEPLSSKVVFAFIVGMLFLALSMILWYVSFNKPSTNCWDLYTTEQQAILHCEGK